MSDGAARTVRGRTEPRPGSPAVCLGVRSAWGRPPRPPSRRAVYLVSPPEPADPASGAGAVGKSRRPSPGVSSLPRRRGCPSLPSSLTKTQRCGWVWGVFQLPRLPLGQHLRQERRRRETWPGRRSSRLPEPLSLCQPALPERSPCPRSKRARGTGQVKPLGSLIPTSCSSSSSSPGARSGSAWVRPCPPCPRGHVTGQLSSPPSHPAAAAPPAGARAGPVSHC